MDIIFSVLNRTMNCLEGICNHIECNIDSGCFHTHRKTYDKTVQTNDLKENELKEKGFKNKICI